MYLLAFPLAAQQAKAYYLSCIERFSKKKYSAALKFINKAISIDSVNAQYYYQRALIDSWLNKGEKFYDDINHSILLDSNFIEAYLLRASRLDLDGYPSNAILDFGRAINVAKEDSLKCLAFVGRGRCKCEMKDYKGAYLDFQTAISLDSNQAAAFVGMGVALDKCDRPNEAIVYYLKGFSKDTTDVTALVNLCFVYGKIGDYKRAMEYGNKSIAKNPEVGGGYNNRGYAKYKLGDLSGALRDINKSLRYLPGNSYAYRNRALVYIQQKKFKEACKDLQSALHFRFATEYGDEVFELQDKYCK